MAATMKPKKVLPNVGATGCYAALLRAVNVGGTGKLPMNATNMTIPMRISLLPVFQE